ncbi:MAG: prevent-host-death protein [Leptospiraceae bacterium]|nr:prevent-host-death protein [Leptospiraceae bacterium]
MKSYSVGQLKSHFSEVIGFIQNGEKVGIQYGKSKRPIALIVPIEKKKAHKRKIGILNGKVTISFSKNFELTEEEFIKEV